MQSITDPWVVQYERLMDILHEAAVSSDLPPRTMRKIFILHRGSISEELFQEGIRLFKSVYKDQT